MERPPYNPYNYILWDFPSPSLNVKYNKSKSQWHSLLRQCLCLWLSILTTAPSKWRKRKYWDRVNRRWWMCEMVGIVEVGEGIVLVWGFYLKSILNSTQLMGLQDHKPTNAYPWVGIQSYIRNNISKHYTGLKRMTWYPGIRWTMNIKWRLTSLQFSTNTFICLLSMAQFVRGPRLIMPSTFSRLYGRKNRLCANRKNLPFCCNL